MKVQIVLDLHGKSNAQILVDADHYTGDMADNPNFMAVDIIAQVSATKAATISLRDTINAPTSDSKTDNIKAARDILNRNLTKLANKVEDVANDPSTPDENRIGIAHSAGMNVKGQSHPQRHKFTVIDSKISGTAHLTAQGMANGHLWEYTEDVINFTGRIPAEPTTPAFTDIISLKKQTEFAFFHKAIIPKTKTDWEGPIILFIT